MTPRWRQSPGPAYVVVCAAVLVSSACQAISGVSDLVVVPAAGGTSSGAGGRGAGGSPPDGASPSSGGDSADGGGGRDGSVEGGGGSSGTGGSSGAGGSSGSGGANVGGSDGGVECTKAADCPGVDDDCGKRACVGNKCSVQLTPAGTATTSQSQGDCKQNVCDSTGGTTVQALASDVENDNNECTVDTCDGQTPKHGFAPANTPCGSGQTKCNATGQCVGCTADTDCSADTECKDWSCGTNGVCTFVDANAGTPCGDSSSCSAGIGTLQDTCSSGTCQDHGTVQCGAFICGATACLATCTDDNDCAQGTYCEGTDCVSKKTQGDACARGAQCSNGNCVDDVCCENACASPCMTCNGTDSQSGAAAAGSCLSIKADIDPQNECAAGRVCNGSGACSGHYVCDCSTAVYSATWECCNNCSNDCASTVGDCNAHDDTPCNNIGNVDGFYNGDGIADQSGQCSPATRCAMLACTCTE